ncbi:MAG TPA: TetR/AcrR family transcriptional regulator [Rhizobiaceae bacterium]|nr:TetR/AcrR family transcriptional regulator [Rhizobiaceae bacterium]
MTGNESARKPRRDAARNREKLIAAAAALVAEGEGELSLATVAERAGVGIGTLYRHFPSRDALLAALYGNEVDRLRDLADMLLEELSPLEALTTWIGRYAQLMAVKYGLADAMKSALRSEQTIFAHSKSQTVGAMTKLLAAAEKAGDVRPDIDPQDVLSGIAAIVSANLGSEESRTRAERLLAFLVDGLRYRAER